MPAAIDVCEPLVQHESPATKQLQESLPSTSSSPITTSPECRRLVSLDVFRGFTVALMILVDDVGGAFPSLNHSPWFGITLADFVMPFFLFGVGFSISLVFKNQPNKSLATEKIVWRTIKLFLLGLFLQGGYFHGRGNLTYGVDLHKLRLMGILQRISIGYLFTSLSEIWLLNNIDVYTPMKFVKRYMFQCVFLLLLCFSYCCLLYGIYVPDWSFKLPTLDSTMVKCGVRGSIEPSCNAAGLIDRAILGIEHIYQRPVYRRVKECSVNSPDYGPLPLDSPSWCLAPFDPEGILSSLMAIVTCLIGLQYGHVVLHIQSKNQRMLTWSVTSLSLVAIGYVLKYVGVPACKALYTPSYTCITGGAAGILLVLIYYIVDVKCIRKPTAMFQWMGMNALLIYVLGACDLSSVFLQGFFWNSPENNLVDGTEMLLQFLVRSRGWGTLLFVVLEIVFWGTLAFLLHLRGVYFKM